MSRGGIGRRGIGIALAADEGLHGLERLQGRDCRWWLPASRTRALGHLPIADSRSRSASTSAVYSQAHALTSGCGNFAAARGELKTRPALAGDRGVTQLLVLRLAPMPNDLYLLEQRWSMAVQGAGFGIWDLDPRRELVHYSPQWKGMLGYPETGRARQHRHLAQPRPSGRSATDEGRIVRTPRRSRAGLRDGVPLAHPCAAVGAGCSRGAVYSSVTLRGGRCA